MLVLESNHLDLNSDPTTQYIGDLENFCILRLHWGLDWRRDGPVRFLHQFSMMNVSLLQEIFVIPMSVSIFFNLLCKDICWAS